MRSEHKDRVMRIIQVHGIISGALMRLVEEKKLVTKLSDQICPLCGVEGKGIVFGSVGEDQPYFSFCQACCGTITMNPAWVEGVVKKGLAMSQQMQPALDAIMKKAKGLSGKVAAFGLEAFSVRRIPRMPKPSAN